MEKVNEYMLKAPYTCCRTCINNEDGYCEIRMACKMGSQWKPNGATKVKIEKDTTNNLAK